MPEGGVSTVELVNLVYTFCEMLAYGNSGKYFFPYQSQLSKRIIRSLLENDGEEITGLQSRQSGKSEVVAVTVSGCAILLPILANTPMFADDARLIKFKHGMLIGLFAPALHQAQIIFNRVKGFLATDNAVAVMEDPEINVTFGTNNGQNIVLQFLNLNITSTMTCMSASEGSNIEGKSYMLIIVDESQDVSNRKYSKSISPMAAFYNGTKVLIGTPTTFRGFFYDAIERNKKDQISKVRKRNHFEYNYEYVCKYNPNYKAYVEGEKRRLGESSDEFQMSYNLKWILERGMFTTTEAFDKLGMEYGITLCDMTKDHVVGIDFGKSSDSTVVTILEVDWDNPIIMEKSKSVDAEVEDFVVYNCFVKNWLEIQGDDWDSQYHEIMAFINNYKVRRIVADATGVGGGTVDRIRANVSYEVWSYTFSTPAKSDLYKHYDAQLKAGRVHYPADDVTKDTREYQEFVGQHIDLVKSWSGQNMVVCHPDVKGAHDDYPDSVALAVWGARGDAPTTIQTENKNVFRESMKAQGFNTVRNRMTARRR